MKKNIIKRFAVAISFMAVSIMMSMPVLAADTETTTDSSGNMFIAGQKIEVVKNIGNELFLAGQDLNVDNVDVEGSAFMAGMNVSMRGSSTGSSLYAAGMNINLDVDTNNNIWTCGQNISLGENTSAKALHVAGETVTINGEYDYLYACGNSIIFNGTVNGDADFEGNVTIGKDAKITGNTKIISPADPKIESGADAGNLEIEIVSADDTDTESITDTVSDVAKKSIGFIILSKIKQFIYWSFAFAVFALVFATMFKKSLTDSYEMSVKTRPLALWISGVVGLVAIPLAVLIMCITVVGAPAGLFILAIYLLAMFIARVFMFASLIRELIFAHTPKRLNPILETVIAVIIGALSKIIPVISGIVGLISKVYILGYLIQTIYGKMNRTVSESVSTEE